MRGKLCEGSEYLCLILAPNKEGKDSSILFLSCYLNPPVFISLTAFYRSKLKTVTLPQKHFSAVSDNIFSVR